MFARRSICFRHALVGVAVVLAIASLGAPQARAQVIQQQVAGVWIDADGILRNVERDEVNKLRQLMEKSLREVRGGLNESSALRKVSLRRLEAAIAESRKTGAQLPDEMKYLAGLQRVQYVFAYPSENDIVLAGPGEGWKINEQGEVVGVTTGRPVLLLDDLLVALRTAGQARQTGISCSIDPTSEGLQQLQRLAKTLRTMTAGTPGIIEETLGLQTISVTGVPADSHFGRVLVAADYKMKRLAMNFDEAPVRGMPSFLDMMKGGGSGMQNMLPRWWLAPSYGSLLADPKALAWEIRGPGVKAVAEEDFLTTTGARQRTQKANPIAKRWADNMTAHYDELSGKDVVFGQLRNCIDLAIVGALITKERLTEKAGYSMPLLLNASGLPSEQFNAPRHVPSQASVVKKRNGWLISASGGVQIDSWSIVASTEPSAELAPVRARSTAKSSHWWWD